jgi:6-phosphogluconate dehydrogenase (decarboxylating)
VTVLLISAVQFGRFETGEDIDFANRKPSTMRKKFGRHDEKRKGVR